MLCPVDGNDLVPTVREGIEIDYCPKCRGVWLDRGELDKIIERSGQYEARQAPALRSDYASDGELYDDFEGDKRKRGYAEPAAPTLRRNSGNDRYDDDDDFDDQRNRRYDDERDPRNRRRKSFLDDIFDIFD